MSDALAPGRLSRVIAAAAERMSARSPDVAAARIGRLRMRPVEVTLDTEPPDLAQFDPDPASFQVCKVTQEPRPIERPDILDDQLERVTPQFFLRNTERLERYADPDFVEFDARPVRDADVDDFLTAARRCGVDRPDLTEDLASVQLRVNVAQRRALMLDTAWSESFGRREVVAVDDADAENGPFGDA